MRKILLLTIFIGLLAQGCVFITLPGVEPLAEKTIGGKGAAKVLVVDVSGTITDEDYGDVLGLQVKRNITARIKEELTLATDDTSVKAVVLRINSPGGTVTTCDIINHELRNFKKKRNIPIVAELMDVAASGGYYVAVASDKIVAHPTTVTGSIGVIAYNINASGLMDKIGITDQTIKSGPKKDIGSSLRQMTDDEKKILQSVIDGLYERFLDALVEGRKDLSGLKRDDLKKIADGRIYTANQALNLKLIDSIGYLDDAIELAKALSGIKEARVVTYSAPRTYKNNIYSALSPQQPTAINLINIDAGRLSGKFGLNFMYLWMP